MYLYIRRNSNFTGETKLILCNLLCFPFEVNEIKILIGTDTHTVVCYYIRNKNT